MSSSSSTPAEMVTLQVHLYASCKSLQMDRMTEDNLKSLGHQVSSSCSATCQDANHPLTGGSSHLVYGIRNTHEEDLELEKQLKLLNKPPVKSIHTEFGYIVDCIDINKQPAYDHPLLKNHKLQREPSVQKSFRNTNVKNSRAKSIFGLHKVQCPTGTVPIRRIMKDDLIRSKIFNNHMLNQEAPGYHYAEVFLRKDLSPYYGVSGTNSVYNPRVGRKDQFTASQLRIQNGPVETSDLLTFGWHTHKGFYLGGRVENISTYGGETFAYDLSIFQDEGTKNWWISLENENIGYFPATLFSNMSSADLAGWGGATGTPRGTTSPQMGSGYFPDGNPKHASYFRKVAFLNRSRLSHEPRKYWTYTFNDKSDCFQAVFYGYQGLDYRYCLHFGGPGGNCGD
ncbi:hypothetical protein Fmac_031135 [Flemingia macrophylla]|uniref:Neprosin PEP catalytic domain-containing protein n=1 Tax=Flemingia macrophylla TaxID=520843 RepID=A0ABD1L171_9FABA